MDWLFPKEVKPKELTPEDYAAAIKPGKYPLFEQEDTVMKRFREDMAQQRYQKAARQSMATNRYTHPERNPSHMSDDGVASVIVAGMLVNSSSDSCSSNSDSGGSCSSE